LTKPTCKPEPVGTDSVDSRGHGDIISRRQRW